MIAGKTLGLIVVLEVPLREGRRRARETPRRWLLAGKFWTFSASRRNISGQAATFSGRRSGAPPVESGEGNGLFHGPAAGRVFARRQCSYCTIRVIPMPKTPRLPPEDQRTDAELIAQRDLDALVSRYDWRLRCFVAGRAVHRSDIEDLCQRFGSRCSVICMPIGTRFSRAGC